MPADCDKHTYATRWDRERSSREEDYAYARTRAMLPKRGRRLERGYAIASHFAKVIAERLRKKEHSTLEESFRIQVDRWKRATGHLSSLKKAIAHPSYLRIIGLANQSSGFELERLLLHELESEPDHWFPALTAITGENPIRPEYDFDEAVAAWLDWGRAKGIL
jgi:hypothetical protein